MNFVKPYAGILSILVIAACSKHSDASSKNNTGNDTQAVGIWQWVRTDGGIAANIHDTPASTGKQIELHLSGDGIYAVFTNGIMTSQGTYNLETKTCICDHTSKTFIDFSADPDLMIEEINRTNLLLSDEYADGVDRLYKRLETGSN